MGLWEQPGAPQAAPSCLAPVSTPHQWGSDPAQGSGFILCGAECSEGAGASRKEGGQREAVRSPPRHLASQCILALPTQRTGSV